MEAGGPAAGPAGGPADEPLAAYVAEELYLAQPRARRAFMCRAALLDALTPEACRDVLSAPSAAAPPGAPGAPVTPEAADAPVTPEAVDALATLEALEAEHLALRLADGTGHRFPAYLQTFLRAEAARTLPAGEVRALHRRAAAHHAARPSLALPHLVAAEAWPEALAAMAEAFPPLLAAGRLAPIARWLDALPAEVEAGEPLAALWRGNVLARQGRQAEAEPHYERARQGFRARGDAAFELKALMRSLTAAVVRDDGRRAGPLMFQAQALLPAGRPEDVADLHLVRALAAERRGDMALMRECNEAVLAVDPGRDVEVATCRCLALLNLSTWASHRGDMFEARRLAGEAATLADARGLYPVALYAAFLVADHQLLQGEVEPAGAFLRALPPRWDELMDWHDRASALAIQGRYLAATGDHRGAEEALRRSLAGYRDADFPEGAKVALERLAWLALQRRQHQRAIDLAAEGGVRVDALAATGGVRAGDGAAGDDEARGNVYDLALALPAARALHLAGRHEAARAAWARLGPALAAIDARYHLARARLYEAATHGRLGDAVAAAAAREAAEALIAAEHYDFLRAHDQRLWEELRAAEAPGGPSAGPGSSGLPTAPDEPGSPGARGPEPPGKLTIRLFGAFDVRQGGVTLDQWPRKKAQQLLAALALSPRGVDAMQLADVWGEPTLSSSFLVGVRVTVGALRRVLEPAIARGDASVFVRLEDERYVLAADQVERCDVWAFEAAIARAERAGTPGAATAAYREALELYGGGLLEEGACRTLFETEREQYRGQALAAALALAAQAEATGDAEAEAGWLARAGAIAPCDEDVYLRRMRRHAVAGRAEAARQLYWDCRRALQRHLGGPPSDAFEAEARGLLEPTGK